MYYRALLLVLVGAALILVAKSQTTAPPTTEQICNRFNGTNCSSCINKGKTSSSGVDVSCYWCGATSSCMAFEFSTAFPIKGISCPSIRYNVGTCKLEVLFIIIIIAVGCLVFVVALCCCCCVCCIACANRRKTQKALEENRYLDEKDNIRARGAERRAERKAKHEEIRRKYGLNDGGEGDASYRRLS